MPRQALDEELEEERRAVLEAPPGALRSLGLPLVMPKLKNGLDRPEPAIMGVVPATAVAAATATSCLRCTCIMTHLNIIPTAGAALSLVRGGVEVRLLSGRWAGDYVSGASEGERRPRRLELGA